jgi:hypothetical protein
MGPASDPSLIVISTEQTNGVQWREVSCDEARQIMPTLFEQLPHGLEERCVSSSRDWSLPKIKKKKEPEWEMLGTSSTPMGAVEEILEHHGAKSRPIFGREVGNPWWGIEFTFPPGAREAIFADIDAGFVMPVGATFICSGGGARVTSGMTAEEEFLSG